MPTEESQPEAALTELLRDLLYPSESDEPLESVAYPIALDSPLTPSQLRDLLGIKPDVYVEEIPEAEFWKPVVVDQDWYEDEEKQRTKRFRQVRHLLRKLVKNRQVFRVGETEVDVYLLGRKKDGHWAGLKTRVVET
ncbi:nuclease A inhibitor family protein [Larkinella bovis]|uniref:Nuclease A inhibitor family protein n=1 Tax=Larkinella bovis TaxID=683041 RepID=A0ABW0I555_9BACT